MKRMKVQKPTSTVTFELFLPETETKKRNGVRQSPASDTRRQVEVQPGSGIPQPPKPKPKAEESTEARRCET